jgi:hypothetical protein
MLGEIGDVKILIEWNEIDIKLEGEKYILWNIDAFNRYFSTLTGLKNKKLNVWISSAEWKDKYSIRVKNLTFVQLIIREKVRDYNLINIVTDDSLMYRP